MSHHSKESYPCPGCQEWDAFDDAYIEFSMEYSRQIMTYATSTEFLDNFPMRLPVELLGPIIAKRHESIRAEMERREINHELTANPEDESLKEWSAVELTENQELMRCAYESLYTLARYGRKMPEMEFPQFKRFLISQNVVVICGFAEGFVANMIARMCEQSPQPFQRWKSKRRKKLQGMRNQEMVDRYVFEMGYGGFERKIATLEREFNFVVPTAREERDRLRELFLVRNCVVHNAGCVSISYKESGQRSERVNVGDPIPLPESEVDSLLDTLVDCVTDLYKAISLQILGKRESELVPMAGGSAH